MGLGAEVAVLLYNGETKRVDQLLVGDKLMGNDFTPRTVLSITAGMSQLYNIRPTSYRNEAANGRYANNQQPFTVTPCHRLALRVTGKPTTDPRNPGSDGRRYWYLREWRLLAAGIPVQRVIREATGCIKFYSKQEAKQYIEQHHRDIVWSTVTAAQWYSAGIGDGTNASGIRSTSIMVSN